MGVIFIFNINKFRGDQMSRKGSIRYQIEKELKAMCRFGESRQEAKNNNTAHQPYNLRRKTRIENCNAQKN